MTDTALMWHGDWIGHCSDLRPARRAVWAADGEWISAGCGQKDDRERAGGAPDSLGGITLRNHFRNIFIRVSVTDTRQILPPHLPPQRSRIGTKTGARQRTGFGAFSYEKPI